MHHCHVQTGRWFREYDDIEQHFMSVNAEAKVLTESIQQSKNDSNYKPVADELAGMLQPLNDAVIKAL